MKKIISVMLCIGMLFSGIVYPNTACAAGDAIEATVWEDFSRANVGEKPKTAQVRATEKEASVTTVKSLGAIGGVNAVKLSYSSLRGYHNIAGDQGFWFVFNKAKSLKNITDVMYYVKLPISRADDQGNNWGKSGIGIALYLGDYLYVQPKKGAQISYLEKNSSEWKTTESQGMYVDFPSGFEGYIKVKLSDLTSDMLTDDIHNHEVEEALFQFSNMGAQCGDGYVNAIYGITADTNSTMVRLNGDRTARFLTTGATKSDIASRTKLLNLAMKAEVLQDFQAYPIGYDLEKHGLVSFTNKTDVKATLVKSVGGVFKTPSIELSSKTVGGFHDTDPFYDVKYPAGTQIDDMKAFLFYIKCASPHPQRPSDSAIRFNLHTEKNGEQKWTLLGKSTIKAMQKGTGVWKSYRGSGDGNGIVYLPADFEGYVMVDIKDMLTNPIADDLKDRTLISSTFQFQAVGGECGNGYIGPLYMITDMTDKHSRLITFNDCDVYSLSTDSHASENDLLNIGPKVGYSYDEFPVSTLEQYPAVSKVTKESAVITWEAVEGAKEYRLDIYKDQIEEGKLSYLCTDSLLSDTCELKLTGLEEGVRYYVSITAMDGNGIETAVYKQQRFMTKQDGTKLTSGTDIKQAGAQEGQRIPTIWLVISISAVVVLTAAIIVLVVVDKRKRRKEK